MRLNDVFYNGKPQSGSSRFARPAFVLPEETFKDPGQAALFDSDSVIGDLYQNILTAVADANGGPSSLPSIFNGIPDQISKYLHNPSPVSLHLHRFVVAS